MGHTQRIKPTSDRPRLNSRPRAAAQNSLRWRRKKLCLRDGAEMMTEEGPALFKDDAGGGGGERRGKMEKGRHGRSRDSTGGCKKDLHGKSDATVSNAWGGRARRMGTVCIIKT